MEDDSFKYLGHETLGELVAELRNKMGAVTVMSDIIKLENMKGAEGFAKRLKPKVEENFLKGMPLILQYLEEFEQYDLDIKKSKSDGDIIERNGSHVHLKMGNTEKLDKDFKSSGEK